MAPSHQPDRDVRCLQLLAESLVQFYAGRKTNRKDQFPQVFQFAVCHMPEKESAVLRDLASRLSGGAQLHPAGIALSFCEQSAARLLVRYSATAYWYWQLVLLACTQASELPLTAAHINHATASLRRDFHLRHENEFGNVLATRLSQFDAGQLERLAGCGVIFPIDSYAALEFNDHTRWRKNPIFEETALELLHVA